MSTEFVDLVQQQLDGLRAQSLYRRADVIEQRDGAEINIADQRLINFSSNDYLGLSLDKSVRQAAADAAIAYGVGSTASPLVCGRTSIHQQLEEALARATGRDRALLFSSGYMANVGTVQAMAASGIDEMLLDRLSHASIIDGVRLAGVRFRRYQHASPPSLDRLLGDDNHKLVLTESLFSMDGDIAPIDEIAGLCRASSALLLVDDAHGFGVLGRSGMGALEYFGLGQDEVPLMMATFGKSLGVHGAFIAGSEELIELIIQKARTYIYSTSMTIPGAAAALAALGLVAKADEKRRQLNTNIQQLRDGLESLGFTNGSCPGPIQPVMIGDNEKAMQLSLRLRSFGFFVPCIRPPTVPRNSARLRLALSSEHSPEQIEGLLSAMDQSLMETGGCHASEQIRPGSGNAG